MKTRINTRHAALVAGALVLGGWAVVQVVPFQPESRVWIQGTSNVRSYTCEASNIQGRVETEVGESDLDLARTPQQVTSGQVSLPVQGLDCRNGTMNSHLRRALKAQSSPTIRYSLTDVGSTASGRARLTGRLEIAGQERPFVVDATVTDEAAGAVRVRGAKQILMSEFGVTPPSLMLGTMKVHDPVTLNFDVVLKP